MTRIAGGGVRDTRHDTKTAIPVLGSTLIAFYTSNAKERATKVAARWRTIDSTF